jgi:hypothetical protein
MAGDLIVWLSFFASFLLSLGCKSDIVHSWPVVYGASAFSLSREK